MISNFCPQETIPMNRRALLAGSVSLFLATAAWLFLAGATEPRAGEPVAKAAKIVPNQKREPTAVEIMRKKMAEAPEMAWIENPMTLAEAANELEKKYGFPKIVMNDAAFKVEDPDAPDVNETPIKLPVLQGLSRAKLLRLMVDRIPTRNAAFLVRSSYIEITTNDQSLPGFQFIDGTFQHRPLDEILAELSDRTGITILVDARAGDKAKTPISAVLQPETNLVTAVRLLADMADLRLIVVDRTLYVTLPTNDATFPHGLLPGAKNRILESA
jgi:hypothetical protein